MTGTRELQATGKVTVGMLATVYEPDVGLKVQLVCRGAEWEGVALPKS